MKWDAKKTRPVSYIVLHGAHPAHGGTVHYRVRCGKVRPEVREAGPAGHCGTRGVYFHPYCRNANSLGVLLEDERSETLAAAQALVRGLMRRYAVPPAHVLRHYDVTHKTCPAFFVERASAWRAFRQGLAPKEG